MRMWPIIPEADLLGCDPGPPACVRPWTWLQAVQRSRDGDAFRSYIAELDAAGLPVRHGVVPWTDRHLRELPVPWDMLVEEFLGQEVLLPVAHPEDRPASSMLRLVAADQPADGPGVLNEPLSLVSTTRPPGARPIRFHAVGVTVGAIGPAARFTDRLRVVTPASAAACARGTRQPLYLTWSPGPGHGVLEVRDSDRVVGRAFARVTRAVRPCPMIPGAQPGQLCMAYGGPWVSRSILGFARWQDERALRLQDVGCDTCGDGAVRLGPRQQGVPLLLPRPTGGDCPTARTSGPWPTRYTEVLRCD